MTGKRTPAAKTERCPLPDCAAPLMAPQGVRYHLQLKHGMTGDQAKAAIAGTLTLDPWLTSQPQTPAIDALAVAAAPPVDPPAPEPQADGDARRVEAELGGPAIGTEGLDELREEPAVSDRPTTTASPAGPAPKDMGRLTQAAVRKLDTLASRMLGVNPDSPQDRAETAELMTPGAEIVGPKMGWLFWVCMMFFAAGAWWAGKMVQRAERRRQLGGPAAPRADQPAPAGRDGKPPSEVGFA